MVCEGTDPDEAIDIVARLLEIVAPMFDLLIEAGWASRAAEAHRLLQAGALASAILHLMPQRYDYALTANGNGRLPVAMVQADGERPNFSYNAQCLPMALLSALLRAVASSSEVSRGN